MIKPEFQMTNCRSHGGKEFECEKRPFWGHRVAKRYDPLIPLIIQHFFVGARCFRSLVRRKGTFFPTHVSIFEIS